MLQPTQGMVPRTRRRFALLLCVMGMGLCAVPESVAARGANLTGRKAPDLSFSSGLNGIVAGSRLSAHRGQVVVLAFWIHTCPICERAMHQLQRRYEQWQHFGLAVVTVVHKVSAGPVTAVMNKHGWTFPVALDPLGVLGKAYHVHRRPAEYVIDASGRVAASNRVTDAAILKAMGAMRERQVLPVPQGAEAIVALVRAGRLGSALKQAEATSHTAFIARVHTAAAAHLQSLAARARARQAAGRTAMAQADLNLLGSAFVGTSLAKTAAALRDAIQERPAQSGGAPIR